ncbi:hypothetical protein [Kitasatospora sp. NPDC058218]|uniref:hypothetical protein n=1 Tax=Kitasatospora sp. NPDC058218 TaxID=3346385 RepID=UPI0036D9BD2D
MTVRSLPRPLALAAAALLVLAPVAGCSSSGGSSSDKQPDTALALPADQEAEAVGGGTKPAFEPADVHLAVGGSVGVSLTSAPLPHGWQLSGEGDPAVLRRGADAKLSSCPPDSAGCGHTVRQTWTATAAGSTTLTWRYVDRASCKEPGNAASCKALAVKDVRVTVG